MITTSSDHKVREISAIGTLATVGKPEAEDGKAADGSRQWCGWSTGRVLQLVQLNELILTPGGP